MYDEDTLYVYSYSDFDEDYVFMETKYELSDVKRLEQENKQLKEQLQQKENIINKARELLNHIQTKYGYMLEDVIFLLSKGE